MTDLHQAAQKEDGINFGDRVMRARSEVQQQHHHQQTSTSGGFPSEAVLDSGISSSHQAVVTSSNAQRRGAQQSSNYHVSHAPQHQAAGSVGSMDETSGAGAPPHGYMMEMGTSPSCNAGGPSSGPIDGWVELKMADDGTEYYERTVVVKEEVVVERIKRVEVNSVVEEVKMVPRVYEVEKIVEVPEIVYKEVPNFKEIIVPELVEQVVYREVPVPHYVEVEVPEVIDEEITVNVTRNIPKGVELCTKAEIEVPRMHVEIEEIPVPLHVPVFIEVPIPVEQIDQITHQELLALRRELELTANKKPTLAEYESIGMKFSTREAQLVTSKELLTDHWQTMCREGATKTRAMNLQHDSNDN